jgi:hypothetical protein
LEKPTNSAQTKIEEPAHIRDCRVTILKSLSQRTSTRVPWYKPIGSVAAEQATAGLIGWTESAPRDVLRSLELPEKLSWSRFAEILRESIQKTP